MWYQHSKVIAKALDNVAHGKIKRLMIMTPPRHGKSLLSSQLFPAYYLRRYPEKHVGLATYGAALAEDLSRNAQAYYKTSFWDESVTQGSVGRWFTNRGGGIWATGVSGPITGRGADLAIIDDAVKGREEADSPALRKRLIEWYRAVFFTRLHPGAALVIIGTRWHEVDLMGWVLQNAESEHAEGWHILLLDQEHNPKDRDFPASCTLLPDWRKPGERLSPDLYSAEEIKQQKLTLGTREWASLHQQRPIPREGSMFRYSWMRFLDEKPVGGKLIRYWDMAGTEGGGDFTVGVLVSLRDDIFTVLDVRRGQWSPGQRTRNIGETGRLDGPGVTQWIEQDSGIAGSDRTRATIAALRGVPAYSEPASGSKVHRAEPFAAQMEAGNVQIVQARWTHDFVEELVSFPFGEYDDQVDAVSGAVNKLSSRPGPATAVKSPWAW